jgi:hypothetical protein
MLSTNLPKYGGIIDFATDDSYFQLASCRLSCCTPIAHHPKSRLDQGFAGLRWGISEIRLCR